ncbi:MAG: hypothetical protein F9K25_00365 [Candidatus Contendobacter sp.]|nr:MAG: hypothetical protein F9K25_00365 [Candidatus Contendobacter sp.]
MMTLDRMVERNQAANLLALQCMLRLGGLMGIGMLGAVRKTLDTYLVCLRHGVDCMAQSPVADSPEKLVIGCVDATTECIERSWQDYRNNLQILLLTQDEALIWVTRIDRALLAAD